MENGGVRNRYSENFDLSKSQPYILDEIDEYVVTLKSSDDLETFYDDLETPGGTECVPDRCVECALRRPISRNTHYHLTQEEAETLKQDDRVINVVPKKLIDSAVVRPLWTQTSSNWDKSSAIASTHRNWGLKRCIDGQQTSNWGSDGTAAISGIVTTTSSGKNVDVVIVDGFINPNHPEMAKNENGTGGTRVVQFNWYSLNNIVLGTSNDAYPYPTTYTAYGDNHGMHVAGTVAGNSQGWARDANVYNLYIYDGSDGATYWADYIRSFHLTKPVNPATGLRNPTIINNSWGYGLSPQRSSITSITYRGVTYNGPFTDAQLDSFGVIEYFTQNGTNYISIEGWFDADLADIQDAISDGVIFVGAAGNSSYKIDSPGGQDYNNTLNSSTGSLYYYHRGSVNTSATNAICVGCIGALKNDSKADFSCTGPRVTVYAPGRNIISSVHIGNAFDYRNNSYQVDKYSGTSMASPQICGVLACALEQYPRMTHTEAVEYIQGISKNQIFEPTATTYLDAGVSGICNSNFKISGTENFIATPNTSFRITTSLTEDEFGQQVITGTISSITNSLAGGVGTASTVPTISNANYDPDDDGFWQLTLPFNITYNNTSYNIINVNTNSYVLFGSRPPDNNLGDSNEYDQSIGWGYGSNTPTISKIQISVADGSAQRIWTNTTGSSPNRQHRVRFEGHTFYTGGVLGSPTLVWEMVFYENTPSQIDLHIGANPRVTLYNVYKDFYNLQGSGNRYLFYRKDRPTKGTILPRVGEKVRKTTGQTWPRMGTLRYKQS